MTTTTANTARLLVNFAANFRGIQLSKAFFGTNFGISDHASIVETTKAYLDMGGLLAYRPGAGVFFPDEEDRGYIVIRSGDRFETQAATLDDQELMLLDPDDKVLAVSRSDGRIERFPTWLPCLDSEIEGIELKPFI
jgi:hypothetical protein